MTRGMMILIACLALAGCATHPQREGVSVNPTLSLNTDTMALSVGLTFDGWVLASSLQER